MIQKKSLKEAIKNPEIVSVLEGLLINGSSNFISLLSKKQPFIQKQFSKEVNIDEEIVIQDTAYKSVFLFIVCFSYIGIIAFSQYANGIQLVFNTSNLFSLDTSEEGKIGINRDESTKNIIIKNNRGVSTAIEYKYISLT